HPPHQEQLLGILLAEVRGALADEVEQAANDREDAGEVPRTRRALEAVPCGTAIGRRQLDAGRVDLVDRRCPDRVDAEPLAYPQVAGLVARISLEILTLAELQRVHEDRDQNEPALRARAADQRRVPVVDRTHRRDEPDSIARSTPGFGGRLQLGSGADQLHRASTSSQATRRSRERCPPRSARSRATRAIATYAGITPGAATLRAARC